MPVLNLKPTHKIVSNYYRAVAESGQLSLLHEGAVAPHFAALPRPAPRRSAGACKSSIPSRTLYLDSQC